ncbi:hypothetical protein OPV22_021531 [Ensete ventricosum]|uniref:RING-type E3 ubiquitin transferase n=1 Tax=Ensete ventricosum TaxID=4639 RepID=A0AAV8QS81_ENSVE|nr:hypothetical protein OPV22_021531 [Ensete ventricosum]
MVWVRPALMHKLFTEQLVWDPRKREGRFRVCVLCLPWPPIRLLPRDLNRSGSSSRKSHFICSGTTKILDTEMDHNGIRNHPQHDPQLSSDIPTRAGDHPSSSSSSGFPVSSAANPGTSNSSHMDSECHESFRNFPPNQALNEPSCYEQPIRGDGYNPTYPQTDYRRIAYKRKSPVMPAIADRANTSGHYQAASSSNCPSYPASLEPRVSPSPQCWPLDTPNMPAGCRNDNNITGERLERNVRSRQTEDFQLNTAWFYASRFMAYPFYSSCNASDPRMTQQWNHLSALMVPQRQLPTPDAFNHEVNSRTARNYAYLSHPNHNINRSVPLPALRHPSIQGMVPAQSGHDHMVIPYSSTISSYSGTGMSIASDIEVPMGMDAAAPSRYMSPLSIMGHTSHGERHSARHAHRRSHLIFNQHTAYSRLAREGILMTDWSALYDSVSLLDQNRDMRLDIDNMSYEELLALEERIGNVCTGLSEETILRCMGEMVYHSNYIQEEGLCAICLEEYKDKEKLGTLNCGHDFHVGCISQWLQMKNVCPICKDSSACSNTSKEQ